MMRPTLPKRHLRSAVTALVIAGVLLSMLGLGTVQARPSLQVQTNSPNGLVINEVFDSQNVASEYFELYNTSAVAIDLSTYVIYNRDGSTPLSNLDDPIIAAGQVRAIGPTQLHTPTIAGSGLARTDFLGLINTSPSDQVIDVVNWGNPPDISWPNYERFAAYFFPAGTIPQLAEDNPKSIQRWPDGTDNDIGRDFQQILRSPGALSCGDPYEDDNSLTTASAHTAGTYLHRICPGGDLDHIAITMSPSVTYTLEARARGSRIDTALRLFDPNGLEIAVDDPPGTRDSMIIFRPTTSGVFRAQVSDTNNVGAAGFDFLYDFVLSAQTPSPTPAVTATATPSPCRDQFEPDTPPLTEAEPLEQNTEQVHTLCQEDPPGTFRPDEDWVRLSVSSGKVYSMYTKDLAAPVDTVITLYDSQLNWLAENDDYQPGSGLASRIDYTFPNTGIYYLRIRDKRNGFGPNYRYTVGMSTTGGLPPTGTPTASPTTSPFSPTPTQPPCGDAFEPDGVPETARTILIGSTQRHSVCPATDADWVRFYARAGKVYTIRTSNLGIGLDTYMYLFDTDAATILAQNDDGGEGVSSRIDFYPQR
ncbi:MAG TPA: pre-peptidase C-terminal domain-containing protein, partial [Chloroflexia bacterium]|nr:pre-peptidase C-terminal domain-containing protein [Chloroflexia bacterium]